MPMYFYNNPWYGFGAFGVVIEIFWWILIVWLIVSLIRAVRRGDSHFFRARPLDVLKERYAKGELTKDQFEQMKKDLRED